MKIGEMVGEWIAGSDFSQDKRVAIEFQQAWKERTGEEYRPKTVCSHLSRAKNGKRPGLKFFFGDADKAEVLFDVLGVDEDGRTDLMREAERVLTASDGEPEAILDLSWYDIDEPVDGSGGDPLLESFRDELILRRGVGTIRVLLKEGQRERLPDDFGGLDWVEAVEVGGADSDEVEAAFEAAAENGSLVVTPRTQLDVGRWMALDPDASMTPENAVSEYVTRGRVEDVPDVEKPLGELGLVDDVEPLGGDKLPDWPSDRRRLIVELRDESGRVTMWPQNRRRRGRDRLSEEKKDAEWRLAAGKALGCEVESTLEERCEAEARELVETCGFELDDVERVTGGWEPAVVKAKQLERYRISGETHGPRLLLKDRAKAGKAPEVVVVDPTGEFECPSELQENERVTVERVEARRPPLEVVQEAVAEWSYADFLRDPWLETVGDSADDSEMWGHARASMLFDGEFDVHRTGTVEHPVSAFRQVFDRQPPQVHLLFDAGGVTFRDSQSVTNEEYLVDEDVSVGAWVCETPPAAGDILVERNKSYSRISPVSSAVERGFADPPVESSDVSRWLERVHSEGREFERRRYNESVFWKKGFSVASTVWRYADERGVMVWRTLQRALECGDPLQVADGRWMLVLGGGVHAFVTLFERRSSSRSSAVCAFRPRQGSLSDLDSTEVSLQSAKFGILEPTGLLLDDPVATCGGAPLPREMYAEAEGVGALIEFRRLGVLPG